MQSQKKPKVLDTVHHLVINLCIKINYFSSPYSGVDQNVDCELTTTFTNFPISNEFVCDFVLMVTASPDALSSLIQECQSVLKSAKLNTNTVRFNEDLSQMGEYIL